MTFHETILDQLKKYREHNPHFNFLVRQRTGAGKRFESGHWFQGNENYAFVGLINASGGINKTRSVGLAFEPKDDGFDCRLQVRYNGEKREELIKCYQNLITAVGAFNEIDAERFDKPLRKLSSNFSELFNFLDQNYEKIIAVFKEGGCEDVLVSDIKYLQIMKNLEGQMGLNKPEIIIEFVNWFFNLPKRKYTALTKEILQKELEKANRLFDIDIFNVTVSNYLNIISYLKQNLNIKDSPFYNFSKPISTHRPRAILGKDNYFKFLNQKFNNLRDQDNINVGVTLNQILYGPPGTGKTFYLKNKLFEKYTVKESSISQEKYFEETVANLTWWQVIALALIEIGTARVNNILENRWVSKKARLSESKNVRATLWGTLQMHTVIESKNVAYTQRQTPFIFDKNEDKSWRLLEVELKEQVPELYDILDAVNNFKANPDKVIKHYDFITFHQSFAYEDFMEGIKPMIPDSETELAETKELGYVIKDGVFKNICKKAQNDPANRYAIFIDEINRGNVSAIFGELITLIETDKRKGAKNEMSTTLPYSKTSFSVPSNLDIYGTMNTADRSVEALDTALRRRFEFKAMMPDYAVIADEIVAGISLAKVLETINKRIELLIDKDHTIGHSYFIAINSEKKLARAFRNKIVPLLQEYFYGDYGKIGLVLGKGFVEKVKNNNSEFANFEYENANDFKNDTYNLIPIDSTNILEAIGLLVSKKEQN